MSTGALDDVTAEHLDPVYVERRVEDWAQRIEALFSVVERWVPPNWATRRTQKVRMDEPLMRHYQVAPRNLPVLEITKNDGSQLTLKPRGLWIVGANGRVDLIGPKGSFVIVDTAESLTAPSWHIAPASNRQNLQPLDQAAFLKAA